MNIEQALQQATLSWRQGDSAARDAARALIAQTLAQAPDHAGAMNLAACVTLEDGQPAAALTLFEKAAAKSPDDATIQLNLARCQWVVGRIEPARRRVAYWATRVSEAGVMGQEFIANLHELARPPAVAGRFYSALVAELRQDVDAKLSAHPTLARQPKVLIAPHAGHIYSGAMAAKAYARLKPFSQIIKRVVLLGPAHRVHVQGLALPGTGAYQTPLGSVLIDTMAAEAISDLPFVSARADAHAPEHSLEVHVPFLQRCLESFVLMPLVVGQATPTQVAQVLERLWGGPDTLIVISTDLSHYHSYLEAMQIDTQSCVQILNFNSTLEPQQACGARPLNGMLTLAQQLDLEIEQIGYCNSGDTAGDKERVVGYGSFALYEKPIQQAQGLPQEAGQQLVQLARKALTAAVNHKRDIDLKTPSELGATFVTLTKNGRLRGCIGSLQAHRPLLTDVCANAKAAALNDPRFEPVTAQEAEKLKVEVSVLSESIPLEFANESHAIYQLQPGVDGLIFECGTYRSTYLPQVWEQISEPRAFLAHLKVKAGLPFDFWSPQVVLKKYRVQKFKE